MLTTTACTTTRISACAGTCSPITRDAMHSRRLSRAFIRAARHYHVKVQAPGERPGLTTQFYFPDESRNRSDGLFRRELVMQASEAKDALVVRFDVVLALK